MPNPNTCVDCMYEGKQAPAPKVETPKIESVFTANYEGQCPTCNLPISVGQRIARMSNDRYIHFACT